MLTIEPITKARNSSSDFVELDALLTPVCTLVSKCLRVTLKEHNWVSWGEKHSIRHECAHTSL